MILYVASTNQGKLHDFAAVAGSAVSFLPLPGLAEIPIPPEEGATFTENAVSKAIFYSQHAPELTVLADDSGLEVDALGGAPGVRSARYAEDRGFQTRHSMSADRRNNLCLLDALGTTREGFRQARYRCALAVARGGVLLATAEGMVDGEIVAVPRGNGGFGYDPLFLLVEVGLTMSEVSAEERREHSHRAQATTALLKKLRDTHQTAQS